MGYGGCRLNSTCSGTATGPGFDYACNTSSQPYTIGYGAGNTTNVFSFNVTSYYFGNSVIRLSSYLKNNTMDANTDSSTPLHLLRHDCQLQYATVQYPIKVQNGTVRIDPRKANETVTFQSVPVESRGMGIWPTVLGGIGLWLYERYSASGDLYANGSPFEPQLTGSLAREYLKSADDQDFINGNISWIDPMSDVLAEIREVMFRTAVAATNASHQQVVPSTDTFDTIVYKSNYGYLAATVVIMVLATGSLLPSLVGWKDLGRQMSLSPIEIAKAFDAPMLQECGSNMTVPEALKVVGRNRIQYGERTPIFLDRDSASDQDRLLDEGSTSPNTGVERPQESVISPLPYASLSPSEVELAPVRDSPSPGIPITAQPRASEAEVAPANRGATSDLSLLPGLIKGSLDEVNEASGSSRKLCMSDPEVCRRPSTGVFYS